MADPAKHREESGDPRQHNPAPAVRGKNATVGPEPSQSHASISSGRSSEASDRRPCEARPDQTGKPLTMGSNGGGDAKIEKDGMEQSINRGGMQERKAS
ncbi:MAG: hypothetical protein ACLGXA_20200 [Acidobacteriota bacterium]